MKKKSLTGTGIELANSVFAVICVTPRPPPLQWLTNSKENIIRGDNYWYECPIRKAKSNKCQFYPHREYNNIIYIIMLCLLCIHVILLNLEYSLKMQWQICNFSNYAFILILSFPRICIFTDPRRNMESIVGFS